MILTVFLMPEVNPEVNRKEKQKQRQQSRRQQDSVIQARKASASFKAGRIRESAVKPEEKKPYPPSFIEGIEAILHAGGVQSKDWRRLFRARLPQKPKQALRKPRAR